VASGDWATGVGAGTGVLVGGTAVGGGLVGGTGVLVGVSVGSGGASVGTGVAVGTGVLVGMGVSVTIGVLVSDGRGVGVGGRGVKVKVGSGVRVGRAVAMLATGVLEAQASVVPANSDRSSSQPGQGRSDMHPPAEFFPIQPHSPTDLRLGHTGRFPPDRFGPFTFQIFVDLKKMGDLF
jgi:hypothetical protein